MGICAYPTPADGSVICLIVVCILHSIYVVKDILLVLLYSLLRFVGIHISSWEEEYALVNPWHWYEDAGTFLKPYVEEFRSWTQPTRFDTVCSGSPHQLEKECIICLTEFKCRAKVNRLPCGHVFHKRCLEEWIKYWKVTCPLCRTRMVPQKEEVTAPM